MVKSANDDRSGYDMKKGPLFEAQVVNWLKENGFPLAERRVMGGSLDRGDIGGVSSLIALELKNRTQMALSSWVEESKIEGANAKARWWAVIHKRKGKGNPADQYVSLTMDVFTDILKYAIKGYEAYGNE